MSTETDKGTGRKALIAVDLGTSTVAVCRLSPDDREEQVTLSRWNAQAAYGADVLSRVSALQGSAEKLREESSCIRTQVAGMIREICGGMPPERIFVAGNTVMQHIFAGVSPESMVRLPFRAQTLFREECGDRLEGVPVSYAPCVSAFIGGDITAGLLSTGAWEYPGRILFLDIGTNAEMALGGAEGFLCCSAASGPAFEGAGVACGMPAVAGAVDGVIFDGWNFRTSVIGGGAPKGICGSGLLDLLSALRAAGVIDETGYLRPPSAVGRSFGGRLVEDSEGNGRFWLGEQVFLSARDVRALQLATGAVAAGIEVLLTAARVPAEQISRVILAGSFGTRLREESAVAVGLLPQAFRGKITAAGNSSLAGAAMAVKSRGAEDTLRRIAGSCRTLPLSGTPDFARFFTERMALRTWDFTRGNNKE